jgi:hypothetical protein
MIALCAFPAIDGDSVSLIKRANEMQVRSRRGC